MKALARKAPEYNKQPGNASIERTKNLQYYIDRLQEKMKQEDDSASVPRRTFRKRKIQTNRQYQKSFEVLTNTALTAKRLKLFKKESPLGIRFEDHCIYCKGALRSEDNIIHAFWKCPLAQSVWKRISTLLKATLFRYITQETANISITAALTGYNRKLKHRLRTLQKKKHITSVEKKHALNIWFILQNTTILTISDTRKSLLDETYNKQNSTSIRGRLFYHQETAVQRMHSALVRNLLDSVEYVRDLDHQKFAENRKLCHEIHLQRIESLIKN